MSVVSLDTVGIHSLNCSRSLYTRLNERSSELLERYFEETVGILSGTPPNSDHQHDVSKSPLCRLEGNKELMCCVLCAVVFAYLAVPGVLKMGFSLNRKCIPSNRVDLSCRFVAGPRDAGSREQSRTWPCAARGSGLSTGAP